MEILTGETRDPNTKTLIIRREVGTEEFEVVND